MPGNGNRRRKPDGNRPPPDTTIDCLCAWSDLLGFGAPLRQGNWDNTEAIGKALGRSMSLQNTAMGTASELEALFLINDGVARNYDFIAERGFRYMMVWLHGVWRCHTRVNLEEWAQQLPGLRTVITRGQRLVYGPPGLTGEEILRAKNPELPLSDIRAIYVESFLKKTVCHMPFEFQMNLAFAKAYSLEALGSRGGLKGPRFFMDNSFVSFFESALDGAKIEFSTKDGPAKMPIHAEWREGEHRLLVLLTPNLHRKYREAGIIVMDGAPIENDQSTVWPVRNIIYPIFPEFWERPLTGTDLDRFVEGWPALGFDDTA